MLDSKLRPLIDPPLNLVADIIAATGITADIITLAGFLCSLCSFAALALQAYGVALCFIILSRLMDGLDGAVARASAQGPSDRGAFFDILTDFIFYGGTVFFFAVGRPDAALAAAFLIFSFIGSGVSFLAYSIMTAKRGLNHDRQGQKSFYYVAGLCEGSETIIFLVLFCLLPDHFAALSILFGILCWITAAGRALLAAKNFSPAHEELNENPADKLAD